nr:MAG TPA_asm: hypothetical protein [Caudoviricetes sp.]
MSKKFANHLHISVFHCTFANRKQNKASCDD